MKMKDKKRSSTTDVRPSARKPSGVANRPFLLPDFDEENYDPDAESALSAKEVTKAVPTIWQKQSQRGTISFKKVAKAITKQRNWSTVLKVKILYVYFCQHHDSCLLRRGFWEISKIGEIGERAKNRQITQEWQL